MLFLRSYVFIFCAMFLSQLQVGRSLYAVDLWDGQITVQESIILPDKDIPQEERQQIEAFQAEMRARRDRIRLALLKPLEELGRHKRQLFRDDLVATTQALETVHKQLGGKRMGQQWRLNLKKVPVAGGALYGPQTEVSVAFDNEVWKMYYDERLVRIYMEERLIDTKGLQAATTWKEMKTEEGPEYFGETSKRMYIIEEEQALVVDFLENYPNVYALVIDNDQQQENDPRPFLASVRGLPVSVRWIRKGIERQFIIVEINEELRSVR